MSEKNWIVERVEIRDADPMLFHPAFGWKNPPEKVAIVWGRMHDGREWYSTTPFTLELWNALGPERCEALFRDSAVPPFPETPA